MKILILGGTSFLGPHVVESALRRKHALTLFNRGKTNPGLFPELEKLRGDRNGDLKSLEGRTWDACVDTSGYVPRQVTDSTALLAKNGLRHYVFVSTASVYPDDAFKKAGVNENTPVAKLADESIDKVTPETYGPLKALCETAAERVMPGRVAVIRPGLIVGPRDPTDRFTYWPARAARGGEILSPAPREAPVQYMDARDLADWIIKLIEDGHSGVFNALGPDYTLTMAELLHGCKCVAGREAEFVWVDEKFLLDQKVGPWMELPLWVPQAESPAFAKMSNARAIAMGLVFRPPARTIEDTLAWHRTRPKGHVWRAGLTPEREAAVLKAWHAQVPSTNRS